MYMYSYSTYRLVSLPLKKCVWITCFTILEWWMLQHIAPALYVSLCTCFSRRWQAVQPTEKVLRLFLNFLFNYFIRSLSKGKCDLFSAFVFFFKYQLHLEFRGRTLPCSLCFVTLMNKSKDDAKQGVITFSFPLELLFFCSSLCWVFCSGLRSLFCDLWIPQVSRRRRAPKKLLQQFLSCTLRSLWTTLS